MLQISTDCCQIQIEFDLTIFVDNNGFATEESDSQIGSFCITAEIQSCPFQK